MAVAVKSDSYSIGTVKGDKKSHHLVNSICMSHLRADNSTRRQFFPEEDVDDSG